MPPHPPSIVVPEGAEGDEPDAAMVYFGQALRAERVKAGVSTVELARQLHQNRATVLSWEAGIVAPRSRNFLRLLTIFPGLVAALADMAHRLDAEDAADG